MDAALVSPTSHVIADHQAVKRSHPLARLRRLHLLNLGQAHALPRLHQREALEILMHTHVVVKPLELLENSAQSFPRVRLNLSEQGFQGAEQPFDSWVMPGAIRSAAQMPNAQRLEDCFPQSSPKHPFIVSTNRRRHAKLCHCQKQMPQQSQCAFTRQVLQAQQTARTVVDDAQHGVKPPFGAGIETQIQSPGVIERKGNGRLTAHSPAPVEDFGGVRLEHLGHPGFTNSDPAPKAPVEIRRHPAATQAMYAQTNHDTYHPFGLAAVASDCPVHGYLTLPLCLKLSVF